MSGSAAVCCRNWKHHCRGGGERATVEEWSLESWTVDILGQGSPISQNISTLASFPDPHHYRLHTHLPSVRDTENGTGLGMRLSTLKCFRRHAHTHSNTH